MALRVLNVILSFFNKKKFLKFKNLSNFSYFKKMKSEVIFLNSFITKKPTFLESKFLDAFSLKYFIFFNKACFFLRKSFFFTKTKYSRIRQICKNIVMLTLLINIVFIFKSNEIYYNFTLENCFSLPVLIFLTALIFFFKKI